MPLHSLKTTIALSSICFLLASSILAKQEHTENLNRKIRVIPSKTAARIGTGVVWESNWDAAVEKSRDTGKPIFWYVPTLPGTFTDRKKEIDRYMLAGPFSWPVIVDELNRNYVPYRKPPTKEQTETFEIKPYKFVEPGFLIVDSNQQVTRRIDHLTTNEFAQAPNRETFVFANVEE